MRIVLKTVEGYIQLYWIKKTETSIVGWIAGDLIKNDFNVSVDTIIDIHFTYPADGNLHHSYKLISPDKETYISVYNNKVKTKIIENGQRHVTEEARTRIDSMPLSIFVPTEKQPSLNEVKYRQFPTIGFNIVNGKFGLSDKTNFILPAEEKGEDLIVDVTKFQNTPINLTAFLRETNQQIGPLKNSTFDSLTTPFDKTRVLEVRCIMHEKKDTNT